MADDPRLATIDEGDWPEVFKYASGPSRVEGATCVVTGFGASDVAEVIGYAEGWNDGDAWQIAGRLKDGRWFYLSAWCDYTGWGCQEGGSAWVADDRDSLVQFGIPAEQRDVWGLS